MRLLSMTACCALVACVGSISENQAPPMGDEPAQPATRPQPSPSRVDERPAPPVASSCSDLPSLPSRLRRLSAHEYTNTVRDLLRAESAPALDLEDDPVVDGFRNNAAALVVSPVFADRALRAAGRVADEVITRLPALSGCAAPVSDACARGFLKAFAARAFRRPLTPAELTAYERLYDVGRGGSDVTSGVRLAVKTMLQSVHFLYRSELGTAPDAASGTTALSDWELASQLSYGLWGTMPDEALTAAASAGTLREPAVLERETRRLLADPRARRQIRHFALEWLRLDDPSRIVKDEAAFTEALKGDLLEETQALVLDAFLGDGADLGRLFVAGETLLNQRLAMFYGVTGPASNDRFERVRLDGTRRLGLFTSAGLLSALSDNRTTAPITRGKFLLENVLCQELPPPPPALEIPAVREDSNATTRQRFSMHGENPTCAGCHRTLDALAFAFEHYDVIGRYRTTEHGKAIDASGTLTGTDVDGAFADAPALLRRLAGSATARACVIDHFSRFVTGAAAPACATAAIAAEVKRASGDPAAMVMAMVRSRDFTWRRTR